MARSPSASNLLLGNFNVYVAELDANGLPLGERHVGNVSNVSLVTAPDILTKNERMTSARGVYKRIVRSTETTLKMTFDEVTIDNLNLALFGTSAAFGQASSTLAAYPLADVVQGLYYSVGKRAISSVVVEPSGGGTPYVVTTDYTVDAANGRIYIVPGGGIASGTDIEVDCAYAAVTASTVAGVTDTNPERYVRLIGDPTTGATHDIELWKVSFAPDGEFGLITDDFATLAVIGTVQLDTVNHPTQPYYRIIERTAAV